MTDSFQRRLMVASVSLLVFLVSLPTAFAADIETRDYTVQVSGKVGGEVHMTIHRQDNGMILMRCDTDIQVPLILTSYKFVYRGLELWKDHRLVRYDSNTDDNGKRYIISAVAETQGIRLKVNNAERIVRPEIWLTSYWRLPDPKLRNGVVPIIDADTGRELDSKLQYVANEKLAIAGQQVPLNHYRLTGKVEVDLWYDGTDRLVRQEWVEQGHKTVVELVRVRR
ncbi:MAG: DUF6134 family protein [Gemmataceae bacterium]